LQEGGTTARRTSEDGLGEIVAGATYNLLPPTENGFIFDVGAKVKFGTADEDKRLGTGEEDYSLQGDLYKTFGSWAALWTLGYRWYGDPSGIDLENVFFARWARCISSATRLRADYSMTGGKHRHLDRIRCRKSLPTSGISSTPAPTLPRDGVYRQQRLLWYWDRCFVRLLTGTGWL
jgi:hypothetical protein